MKALSDCIFGCILIVISSLGLVIVSFFLLVICTRPDKAYHDSLTPSAQTVAEPKTNLEPEGVNQNEDEKLKKTSDDL